MQEVEDDKLALVQKQRDLLGRLESVASENLALQSQMDAQVQAASSNAGNVSSSVHAAAYNYIVLIQSDSRQLLLLPKICLHVSLVAEMAPGCKISDAQTQCWA